MKQREIELYLHIPFCVKKCDYCDFLSFPSTEEQQERYVKAMIKEICFYGRALGRDGVSVSSVFFGGGTPTLLTVHQVDEIMKIVKSEFSLEPDCEITMECNPGTASYEKLKAYRDSGVNRLSIGCQSTVNEELRKLGRIHTYEQFLQTYEWAVRAGFTNVNVDLMSSIPGQTKASFYKNLQNVVRLKPNHLSVYSLIVEEGTPFYEMYQKGALDLPDEDEAYEIYQLTQQYLQECGYERYEISNYAKPGYACRHNEGYWERREYLGLGLGAASLMEEVRYTNVSDLEEYLAGAEKITFCSESYQKTNLHETAQPLTKAEQMEEFMFLGLRMKKGISRETFEQYFGVTLESVYAEPIAELIGEGLIRKQEGRVFLSERGLDLANYAMAKFLL